MAYIALFLWTELRVPLQRHQHQASADFMHKQHKPKSRSCPYNKLRCPKTTIALGVKPVAQSKDQIAQCVKRITQALSQAAVTNKARIEQAKKIRVKPTRTHPSTRSRESSAPSEQETMINTLCNGMAIVPRIIQSSPWVIYLSSLSLAIGSDNKNQYYENETFSNRSENSTK